MSRVEIEGFQEARETLQSLSKAVQKNAGRKALRVAAEIIASAVRANAAVSTDPNNKTPGSLRDSVTVSFSAKSFSRARNQRRQRRGTTTVEVIADDVAAVPNEYGTTNMAAQPFFRPAVDSSTDRAGQAFAAALKPEIEAAAQRAAKRSAK